MKNKNKLVLIEWLDSRGVTNQWEFKDELTPLNPYTCTSVGFLLEDAKDYKTLAQSMSKDQVIGRISIPACSIKKIKKLK